MSDTAEAAAVETAPAEVSNPAAESGEDTSGFMAGLESVFNAPSERVTDTDTGTGSGIEDIPKEVQENEQQVLEPKADEVPDADLEDAPKGMSSKGKDGWKALKSAKREVESERDRLRTELEQLKGQPQTQQNSEDVIRTKAELDEVRQKLQNYEQKLAVHDVTQTDEYQENIGRPLENAQNLVGAYVREYSLDEQAVAKVTLMENPLERNKALAEMTQSMNEYDKLEFKKYLDDTKTLFMRSLQVKENAAESMKYVEQQRKAEEDGKRQKFRETLNSETERVWNDFTKEVSFIAEDKASAEKLISDAKNFDFDSATPDQRAFAAIAVATLPSLKNRLAEVSKELQTYKDAAVKRSASNATIGTGSVRQESAKPKSFEDGLKELSWR